MTSPPTCSRRPSRARTKLRPVRHLERKGKPRRRQGQGGAEGLRQAERLQHHHRRPQQPARRGRRPPRRSRQSLKKVGIKADIDQYRRRASTSGIIGSPVEREEQGLRHHHDGLGRRLPDRLRLPRSRSSTAASSSRPVTTTSPRSTTRRSTSLFDEALKADRRRQGRARSTRQINQKVMDAARLRCRSSTTRTSPARSSRLTNVYSADGLQRPVRLRVPRRRQVTAGHRPRHAPPSLHRQARRAGEGRARRSGIPYPGSASRRRAARSARLHHPALVRRRQ